MRLLTWPKSRGSKLSEPESTPLSLITDAASGIPEPVRKSLFTAFEDLLGGLVSVPTTKLEQYAQAIKDTTSARSKVADALAKTVADEASKDPKLVKAAAEIYLPMTLRKMKNRLDVAKSAAEHLAKTDINTSGEECAAPGDDWMNRFSRFAEDASSEHLQDLFGRILAG